MPYCVKLHPDEDKQQFLMSGMQDKKVIQWDLRSGEAVQEYDRHLGAVNTITFFDQNRRFCTTSDDKSLRIWEWEIPVDTKLIQDPSLHSMPTVTMSPNSGSRPRPPTHSLTVDSFLCPFIARTACPFFAEKWLVGQGMDSRILLFQLIDDKLRFAKKKAFKGHMVAGYACSVDFSPDMRSSVYPVSRLSAYVVTSAFSPVPWLTVEKGRNCVFSYLMSGDADGKLWVWDWKTHRVAAKWKAHDNVAIGCLLHIDLNPVGSSGDRLAKRSQRVFRSCIGSATVGHN